MLNNTSALSSGFSSNQFFSKVINRNNNIITASSKANFNIGNSSAKIDSNFAIKLNKTVSVVKAQYSPPSANTSVAAKLSSWQTYDRRQKLNEKFGRSGVLNYDINFRGYIKSAKAMDVSTREGSAVLYSGKNPLEFLRNRKLAEIYAKRSGGQTLERGTVGGRWLEKEAIFNRMTYGQAMSVWSTLSRRFASGAKGKATAFVQGADPESVFNSVEKPVLIQNNTEIVYK